MLDLTRTGDVFVLKMQHDDNQFSIAMLDALDAAFDEVERSEGAAALVTTGTGKFFSNGLDLGYLGSPEGQANLAAYVSRVQGRIFARVLELPIPTVAAINGHAFAAGAMLAMCHDFRVMRDDRGFFCLPEVDINIPFTPGMDALLKTQLGPRAATKAMVWGHRFAAEEALAYGIVDEVTSEEQVVARAVEIATPLVGKTRGTVAAIKQRLHGDTLATLRDDNPLA